jgi:hypothetical protein
MDGVSPEDLRLFEQALLHAKTLLTEMGEFFPYAMVRGPQGSVRPYLLYPEDGPDEVSVSEFRTQLMELLTADIQAGVIGEYIIATNVRARRPGSPRVFDAVEIMFSNQNTCRPTYYVEYETEDGFVRCFDPFAVSPDEPTDPS